MGVQHEVDTEKQALAPKANPLVEEKEKISAVFKKTAISMFIVFIFQLLVATFLFNRLQWTFFMSIIFLCLGIVAVSKRNKFLLIIYQALMILSLLMMFITIAFVAYLAVANFHTFVHVGHSRITPSSHHNVPDTMDLQREENHSGKAGQWEENHPGYTDHYMSDDSSLDSTEEGSIQEGWFQPPAHENFRIHHSIRYLKQHGISKEQTFIIVLVSVSAVLLLLQVVAKIFAIVMVFRSIKGISRWHEIQQSLRGNEMPSPSAPTQATYTHYAPIPVYHGSSPYQYQPLVGQAPPSPPIL
jgi:energy-coupling factor transporter transmembrane protein EcfT